MTIIKRSLVSDQVFRGLVAGILEGRYGPGEKLPTQRALAADLGVNMASVREAVKRLEQMRLIEVRQGDAMRVRDWRRHGGLDVITHVLFSTGGLDRSTLADVFEARRLLLTQIARLAATRRSEEEAVRLEELAERFAVAEDDAASQQIDWQFHAEMAEAARNLLFRLLINSIRDLYFERAKLFRSLVARRDELAPLMKRAASGVKAGNSDEAAVAVSELAEAQEKQLMADLESEGTGGEGRGTSIESGSASIGGEDKNLGYRDVGLAGECTHIKSG